MNAATRALSTQMRAGARLPHLVLNRQTVLFMAALFMVLATAFAVVYERDLDRQLVGELQGLKNTEAELNMAGDQMLLEQTTWSSQARVQQVAQQQLGMTTPDQNAIVMVRA
ncbi:MAG: cell division protein FtsL [Legionellales bacterium]|nr:cell division protein FtsL [Legionellales bacterium]|tara:strand:+ start:10557 stop:10892 length:336 start_codon:yes stop_codon:yes gene_type:complete